MAFFFVITKTRLFKYIDNFTTKDEDFQMKISDIFHISAQNIDCGFLIDIHIFNDKQCRCRSVGFFRSQLIWIYTVC